MNLADFLTDTSKRIPDHPAIRYEGNSITFAEMNCKVDALCRGFTRIGLNPGDVCVQMMPSSLNWAIVYYALAKMGAFVVLSGSVQVSVPIVGIPKKFSKFVVDIIVCL